MDLEIWTDRPEKRATCRACHWDTWLEEDTPPPHSCRTAPNQSRTSIEAQLQAAERVFADRELEIRRTRLAELRLQRGYR